MGFDMLYQITLAQPVSRSQIWWLNLVDLTHLKSQILIIPFPRLKT